MVDGVAGLPGVPALEVKCQEVDPAPIRPPAGWAVTALDLRQNKSNAETKKYSIYSESQTSHFNLAIC